MEALRVENLTRIYHPGEENEVCALDGVSFALNKGDFAVCLGPSGAGKSTLLNILGGMDVCSSGTYVLNGKDVSKFNAKQLSEFRRTDIGFIFQFYNLMPNLTALENVALAASVVDSPLNPEEVLADVGLASRKNNFPAQLSGGEQQRVAIARALVKDPVLLLADEPTGALDSATGASVLRLLLDVAAKRNKTVVVVTHNAKIAEVAHRVLRVRDGKLVANEYSDHIKTPEEITW